MNFKRQIVLVYERYEKEILKELLIRRIFIGGYFLLDQLIDHRVYL